MTNGELVGILSRLLGRLIAHRVIGLGDANYILGPKFAVSDVELLETYHGPDGAEGMERIVEAHRADLPPLDDPDGGRRGD